MEHRFGLVVDAMVTAATGLGERDAAVVMAERIPGRHRITLAGDKAYDTRGAIAEWRRMGVAPHDGGGRWRSSIAGRTTRHAGYAVGQRKRKLVEQAFGWRKTVSGLRKLHHRGGPLVEWIFTFTAAVYNIVRMRRLLGATV